MSQIEELQSRITAAMDRIGVGVEVLSNLPAPEAAAPADAAASDADLVVALEDEKMANAQLEERLKTLKSRHDAELAAMQQGAGGEDVSALKAELEQLWATAAEPSETDALRSELDELRAQLTEKQGAEEAAAAAANAVEELRAENETLTAQLEAVEDVEPLRAELAVLRSAVEENEQATDLKAENDMLRAERVSHGAAMSRLDDDLQRLRKANEQLREVNGALREANAAGVGDPELINKAMQAELEALRSARATDVAEAQAVLAQLEPLLAQAELVDGEEA